MMSWHLAHSIWTCQNKHWHYVATFTISLTPSGKSLKGSVNWWIPFYCIDSDKHKQFTGVNNELILSNFKKLCERFPNRDILVRTPVIPGFNDTEDDILSIIDFIKDIPNVKYEILGYHRLSQCPEGP